MEDNNKNNKYKSFMIVIITALITCIITTIVIYNYFTIRTGGSNLGVELNTRLNEIRTKLNQLYIGEIDEEKMMDGALEGYVSALGDEYTEYLTKEEITSLMQDIEGSYVGIGVYIAQNTQTDEIIVIGVIEDSPAHKAGLLAGDIIKKIDGVEYTGEDLTQASNKMKGIEGTKVTVTVERDGKESDIDITRKTIKFKYIDSEKLENDIGYIKISSFEGDCANDFKNAYKELSSQGIKSLIIDLRNNGGGLVDQSLDIAEMIVPYGSKLLITKDKNGNEEISTSDEKPIVNVPIVILVNEFTASASEILTAAVKENINCKVVGTQTYGKGIIQGIFLFDDNETGIKITIQEYFTPNYNKLHKIGIKPDEVIELPEEWKGQVTVDREFDNQLNRAIEILSE